ncbi:HNH endonuclease [Pseudoxanthomonas sacheonensis]|uniref:5-methylcytosine-specific restriction endonuclease McrA n=1 Tax=Pseudoxanthomonas sacheonensis TaxID=443615 RepID=A0ABU1RUF4_9GAMM|nr:HNH endonuclease signature motif containing protein [Pseudoxanthomonas sacheonensis]MDR6842410.1 5-methylcytosine-specific restriction endonuclease McrA [Pseudoxanthomonas sacheonensis]
MRYVDRREIDTPPSLAVPSVSVAAEKEAARVYYANMSIGDQDWKGYSFKQYKDHDVCYRLRILFCNKCAYCESDLGSNLDVEHYRPKCGVTEEETHSGYWWLAHAWENLLPSCDPCNRKRYQVLLTEKNSEDELLALRALRPTESYGKANHFPILGERAFDEAADLSAELPLLLDPTNDRPDDYLDWSIGSYFSIVCPLVTAGEPSMQRAVTTISIFALNRLNLVQSRTEVLNELRFQASQIEKDLERHAGEEQGTALLDSALLRADQLRRLHEPHKPYSGMAKAFVDRFISRIAMRAAGADGQDG